MLSAGTAAGLAAACLPPAGVALLLAATVAVAVLLVEAAYSYRLFWALLIVVLAGYAFLGKGFAYLGVPGFYVGEAALAAGISTVVVAAARRRWQPRRLLGAAGVVPLVAFLVWQAARTWPFVGTYGIDALRDGALWGYAAFALCIALVVPRQAAGSFVRGFGRVIPFFLIGAPAVLLVRKLGVVGPHLPWSDMPILLLKGGDIGAHLGGIGAYLLLSPGDGEAPRPARARVLWIMWWCGWCVVAAAGRAAALSALMGVAVAFLFARKRSMVPAVLGGLVVAGAVVLADVRTTFRGARSRPGTSPRA